MKLYLSLTGEVQLTEFMSNPDCLIFESKSEFNRTVSAKLFDKLMERPELDPDKFSKFLTRKSLNKIYDFRDNGIRSKLYFNRLITPQGLRLAGYLSYIVSGKSQKEFMFIEEVDLMEEIDKFCHYALSSFTYCLGLKISGLEIKDLFLGYDTEEKFIYNAKRIHIITPQSDEYSSNRQMIILADMLRTGSEYGINRLKI